MNSRHAITRKSNLAGVEEKHLHIGVTWCEDSPVCSSRSPLRARESLLDRRQIVEMQRRDQMKAGGSSRRRNGTLADLVLSQTGEFLCDRNVRFEVMPVESGDVLWCPVNHYHPGHCISPCG